MNFFSSSVLTAISGVGVYVSPHIKSIFYPNAAININTKLTHEQQQMRLKEMRENMKLGKYTTQFTKEEIESIVWRVSVPSFMN